ncbi:hypothetical protein Nepgr_008055 [Nepenthes gracilis]|uniref:Uncharacterized protein n=1 Tax=Nepenthes gracilis TaxID=150966 RepID=A0AAD3S830_NEPGR|nr:hypothetical protein Nepgr_008055 [Nepenthes gracilis]
MVSGCPPSTHHVLRSRLAARAFSPQMSKALLQSYGAVVGMWLRADLEEAAHEVGGFLLFSCRYCSVCDDMLPVSYFLNVVMLFGASVDGFKMRRFSLNDEVGFCFIKLEELGAFRSKWSPNCFSSFDLARQGTCLLPSVWLNSVYNDEPVYLQFLVGDHYVALAAS